MRVLALCTALLASALAAAGAATTPDDFKNLRGLKFCKSDHYARFNAEATKWTNVDLDFVALFEEDLQNHVNGAKLPLVTTCAERDQKVAHLQVQVTGGPGEGKVRTLLVRTIVYVYGKDGGRIILWENLNAAGITSTDAPTARGVANYGSDMLGELIEDYARVNP